MSDKKLDVTACLAAIGDPDDCARFLDVAQLAGFPNLDSAKITLVELGPGSTVQPAEILWACSSSMTHEPHAKEKRAFRCFNFEDVTTGVSGVVAVFRSDDGRRLVAVEALKE